MSQIFIQLSANSPAAASTTLSGAALAATAITDVATAQGMDAIEAIRVEASIVGVTGGTLDVFLETSMDGGTTWTEYIHWTQLAAGGAAKRYSSSHSIYNASAIADTGAALGAGSSRDGVFGPMFRLKMTTGPGVSTQANQVVKIYGAGA